MPRRATLPRGRVIKGYKTPLRHALVPHAGAPARPPVRRGSRWAHIAHGHTEPRAVRTPSRRRQRNVVSKLTSGRARLRSSRRPRPRRTALYGRVSPANGIEGDDRRSGVRSREVAGCYARVGYSEPGCERRAESVACGARDNCIECARDESLVRQELRGDVNRACRRERVERRRDVDDKGIATCERTPHGTSTPRQGPERTRKQSA